MAKQQVSEVHEVPVSRPFEASGHTVSHGSTRCHQGLGKPRPWRASHLWGTLRGDWDPSLPAKGEIKPEPPTCQARSRAGTRDLLASPGPRCPPAPALPADARPRPQAWPRAPGRLRPRPGLTAEQPPPWLTCSRAHRWPGLAASRAVQVPRRAGRGTARAERRGSQAYLWPLPGTTAFLMPDPPQPLSGALSLSAIRLILASAWDTNRPPPAPAAVRKQEALCMALLTQGLPQAAPPC